MDGENIGICFYNENTILRCLKAVNTSRLEQIVFAFEGEPADLVFKHEYLCLFFNFGFRVLLGGCPSLNYKDYLLKSKWILENLLSKLLLDDVVSISCLQSVKILAKTSMKK